MFLVSQWLSGLSRIKNARVADYMQHVVGKCHPIRVAPPSFTERKHQARRLYTLTFQESRTAAYGFFPDESQLENVLRALNVAGFENEDLCVLIASEHAIALPVELLATSERGVFAGLGISPSVAARYESRMRDKASFVFVSCDDLAQSEWARELLTTMGAEEVSLLSQESDSQKEQGGTKSLAN